MYGLGEVQEWLNWLLSKSSEPARVPWVRIPPSPPLIVAEQKFGHNQW